MTDPACGVCSAPLPAPIPGFDQRHRVTSDCKPYPAGGAITQCAACGAVQKPNDEAWRADCEAIYATYDNYSLTDGVEQFVRGGAKGQDYAPRSDLVLKTWTAFAAAEARGRMLDYGCGKGPTTRAAARLMPGWTIDGYDLDRRAEETLAQIPNFETLFTGDPGDIPHRYDLIILMHALEHIPDGYAVLRTLGTLLTPTGQIVVQVPNRLQNPFDLVVADHTLHFDRQSLHGIAIRAGLTPLALSEQWVVKELSMVAGHGTPVAAPAPAPAPAHVDVPAAAQVDWLDRIAQVARSAGRPVGIFGTSIVGTWLAAEMGAGPDFWIDEDPAKKGLQINGAPVLAPDAAPTGSTVLMAMAPRVAGMAAERLSYLDLTFVPFPDP